jgi:hypothetical protein
MIETAAKLPVTVLAKQLKRRHVMSAQHNNPGEVVLPFSLDFKLVNSFRKEFHATRVKYSGSWFRVS